MKGRTPPPRITVADAAQMMFDRPGTYVLEIRHDDACPTIRTQDERLCTCKTVEHVLVKIGGAR